ncbi:cyclin-A1-4-like [Rutidosis leptorrhynchoides]|uniref:cyclin-A1-4-like n=1 Tax=Rutidosis leptorrhynchoides TaxID=125765 RepID=UPI003A9999F0
MIKSQGFFKLVMPGIYTSQLFVANEKLKVDKEAAAGKKKTEDVPAPLVIKKEPKSLWDDEDEPAPVTGSSGEKYINLVRDIDYTEAKLYGIPAYDCYYPSFRATEAKKRIRDDYMDEVLDYAKIYMRAVTIDWLVKISDSFDIWATTLHLAVNYLDRYLCATPIVGIQQFQLIGASCIVIAS